MGRRLLGMKVVPDGCKPYAATYYTYVQKTREYASAPTPQLAKQIAYYRDSLEEMRISVSFLYPFDPKAPW